jgi:hypothetical protein
MTRHMSHSQSTHRLNSRRCHCAKEVNIVPDRGAQALGSRHILGHKVEWHGIECTRRCCECINRILIGVGGRKKLPGAKDYIERAMC